MKAVCCTPLESPSPSLIKSICYPLSTGFTTKATAWGYDNEQQALSYYCQQMISHANFTCETSGLVINPELPHMGATPDGMIHCDCCGDGVVEVKCPFCARECASLKECVDSRFCLEDSNGKLQLKHSHAYYYQVQTQLLVSNREFADFVVWSEHDVHIERIEPDVELWELLKSKSRAFFYRAILPELVGKLNSRPCPSAMPISKTNGTEMDTICHPRTKTTGARGRLAARGRLSSQGAARQKATTPGSSDCRTPTTGGAVPTAHSRAARGRLSFPGRSQANPSRIQWRLRTP